jgi:hypothetical protein
MKNHWYLSILLMGACGSEARAQPALPHGRIVRHLTVDGVVREVVLHVPVSVDGTRAVPVVFMLHGLCTDEQIAALPPAKQDEIESRVLRDDVAFFDAIVTAIEQELPADPRRLYVTGFSNGASMSGRLLIDRSDTFAAFAMAAGLPAVPGPAQRSAPVVFTVGSLDDRFLTPLGLPSLPLDEGFLQIPEVRDAMGRIALDVQLDNTRFTYAPIMVQGHSVPTFTYSDSLVGASNLFKVAVIEGATHQYPNGENHPVMMADWLWSFFSRYGLP